MEFGAFTRALYKEVSDDILRDLKFIAQGCYESVMKQKQFATHTGALASSIGWGIFKDGTLVYSGGFEGGNTDGATRGRAVMSSMSRGKGIRLVLVAGMSYASFVEARGFNVNTSGELLAEEMIKWWLNA